MDRAAKERGYRAIAEQIDAYLDECDEPVSAMATVAALLKEHLPHVFWAGFYLARPDGSLRVGPYQGPPGSVLLPPGKGVCGAAYTRRETVLVPDVHDFPGHIACDLRSRSEIVVPVRNGSRMVGVLDVDSERVSAFDDVDRTHLERLAGRIGSLLP